MRIRRSDLDALIDAGFSGGDKVVSDLERAVERTGGGLTGADAAELSAQLRALADAAARLAETLDRIE